MEPTKEFIQMCKDADEIQGHWFPEVGDPVSTIENDEFQGTLIRTNDHNFTAQKTDRFGKIFYGAICNRQLTRRYYVWLPRVDQLQEYTRKKPDAMFDRFREFYSKMTSRNSSLKAKYRILGLL